DPGGGAEERQDRQRAGEGTGNMERGGDEVAPGAVVVLLAEVAGQETDDLPADGDHVGQVAGGRHRDRGGGGAEQEQRREQLDEDGEADQRSGQHRAAGGGDPARPVDRRRGNGERRQRQEDGEAVD